MKNKDRTALREKQKEKKKKRDKILTVLAAVLIPLVAAFTVLAVTCAIFPDSALARALFRKDGGAGEEERTALTPEEQANADKENIIGYWYCEKDGVQVCWQFDGSMATRYSRDERSGQFVPSEKFSYLLHPEKGRLIFTRGVKQSEPFDYRVTKTTLELGMDGETLVFRKVSKLPQFI